MEVELKLDPKQREPKAVILAAELTPELKALAEQLAGLSLGPIQVREGERTLLLPQEEFLRFYTDGKSVAAQTAAGVYAVGLRLYELEERLDRRRFVRISNSEIVNLDKVTALDLSITGTIRMTLDHAVTTYASRRCVKKIKEALGLRKGEHP